ncbi:hypothetical protein [Metallosphaera cuprina]|uniref:Uncharacterized protein n=2 Tax=Metallosphaera TaxID=41980 RepID=F4FY91_METCR|nr:hypothetical protein [Metallosphaera cuprina]AEB95464.1 conserved hypothetical protein [Metallosphaera cuprina Ar-4]
MILERASKMSKESFLADEQVRLEVRKAIEGMLSELSILGSNLVDGRDEDLIWNLARKGVILAPLAQELSDIISIYRSGVDELIFVNLVRIMEDIEEAYYAIKSKLLESQK